LNSRALEALGTPADPEPAGLERMDGQLTGRLYEGDTWLRTRMKNRFPDLTAASQQLARYGVTGITDTTPTNGCAQWAYFQQCQRDGQLLQQVRMMGLPELRLRRDSHRLHCGELKVHLLESQLPEHDALCQEIANAHAQGRSVAVHCVTLTESVFALSALETAGVRPGDRIEHASVTPPPLLQWIASLGLRVVIQPHFIAERGDQYLADVEPADQPWLYRAAGFIAAGVPVAGGSDAPFGNADPWHAMRAAVERKTGSGTVMAAPEALTPEQALGLFLGSPDAPGIGAPGLRVGARADLCLLDRPWRDARRALRSDCVRSTWQSGSISYSCD
jgi:predicted amidohydrolase YtcJ